MPIKRVLPSIAIAALVAVPAFGATPESGTISHAAPILKWTGTANGYLFLSANQAGYMLGMPTVCDTTSGTCDEFKLEVADQDVLTIQSLAGDNTTQVAVQKPDGSTLQATGDSSGHPSATVQIGRAEKGSYIVRTWVNNPPGLDGDYTNTATLGKPHDPESDAGAQPQPRSAPAATITVKTKAASLRAVARAHRLRLALSASGSVTKVQVALAKGRTVVARGALARLNGRATVALKIKRRLAAGVYKVLVSATDAGGAAVGATAPLKLKR